MRPARLLVAYHDGTAWRRYAVATVTGGVADVPAGPFPLGPASADVRAACEFIATSTDGCVGVSLAGDGWVYRVDLLSEPAA